MLTISENKHDTGLAFLIWLFVVLKVVEKNNYIILGDIVYGIWPTWLLLIQVNLKFQNHKIPKASFWFISLYVICFTSLFFLKAPGLKKDYPWKQAAEAIN